MKVVGRRKIFIAAALFLLVHTCAFAKDIAFEATVDRNKVKLGQSLELDLTFYGTKNIPAMKSLSIEGFRVRYVGPSTRMSIINGKVSNSITSVYMLLPIKLGVSKIGPFKFEHNGDTYNSNSLNVEVVEASAQSDNQFLREEQPEAKDLNNRVFLEMTVEKNKVYLNEIVPVTFKLFVSRFGVRDIQFPQFSHDGFSVDKFEQPRQYREAVGGVNYNIIEFNTTIFGLKPGELHLGPASLQCNLVTRKQNKRKTPSSFNDFFNLDVFNNFFSEYQAYPLNLASSDITITVLPLPKENKPASFSGALGLFDFEAAVSPLEVKVGDPITLKVTVSGQGNFNTVTLPAVGLGNDFKTYEPQIRQDKEKKTFEQVLIPLSAAIKEIPVVSFSFFNTQTGKYETITRGPFSIKIGAPEKEEKLKIIESKRPAAAFFKEEKLGSDILYIKDSSGKLEKKEEYLYANKMFLGLQIIPLLIYLLIAVVHARNKRLRTDIKFARQLLAPRKAKAGIRRARSHLEKGNIQEFYDMLFEILQEYLGDKFHLSSKGITISIIDEQLKNRGISEEILARLKDVFFECDMVRYAASQFNREKMQNSLKKLEETIDYLQRNKA